MMGCNRLIIAVFAGLGLLWAGDCACGQEILTTEVSIESDTQPGLGEALPQAADTKRHGGLRLMPVAGLGGSLLAGVNGNLSQIGAFAEAGLSIRPADGYVAWQLLLHAAGGWLAADGTWQLKLGLALALPALGQVLLGYCTVLPLRPAAGGEASWFPLFALRTPIVQYLKAGLLVNLALDLSWTAYLQPNRQFLGEGYYLPLGQDDFMRGIQAGLALVVFYHF